ncbi:MAG: hypothetical protein HOV80_32565 [Polyangiaceae bacterium]|nr:hypothetical protein [Polyangiaceae bacterium]
MTLTSFAFEHDGCFLLPLEELSPRGMSGELASAIATRGLLSKGAIELFDAALACLHDRLSALHAAAPNSHVPPRLLNILVITAADTTRPFFQPLPDMSAVLYAADLDPDTSTPEHAAFQLLFAERLGQSKRYGKALLASLPFLLSLDDARAAAFIHGAERATRPDAEMPRRLSALLPRIRTHVFAEGAGQGATPPEGWGKIQGTGLAIDRAFFPELSRLGAEVEAASGAVATTYLERQRRRTARHEDDVVTFLRESRPQLLVLGEDGTTLWDPDKPAETDALAGALASIGELPAKSLVLDLTTIDRVTQRFFETIAEASALEVPVESMEEAGGVFVHHERKLVAYALVQPGLDARVEAAPPVHRLLLAARTAHEWGHLAVDSGLVPIPEKNRRRFDEASEELRGLFLRIYQKMPASAKPMLDEEVADLEKSGTRIEMLPLTRIEDYRSNLISRRILRPEELEAYVRVNVRSLAAEPIGILQKLARYAYEGQYLGLISMTDPFFYLFSGTYLREELIAGDFVSEAALRELFHLVGTLCASYEIDETKLKR